VLGIYWILHHCRGERDIPVAFFTYGVWETVIGKVDMDPLLTEYTLYIARELAEKCGERRCVIDIPKIANYFGAEEASLQIAAAFAMAGIATTRPQLFVDYDLTEIVREMQQRAMTAAFVVRPWIHNAMAALLRLAGPDVAIELALGGVMEEIVLFPLDTSLAMDERVEYNRILVFLIDLWQQAIIRGVGAEFWDAYGKAGGFDVFAEAMTRPEAEFGSAFETLKQMIQMMAERPMKLDDLAGGWNSMPSENPPPFDDNRDQKSKRQMRHCYVKN
jgi:hypothetical protein